MNLNFALVRSALFGGKLTQAQVDGINVIFAAFDRYGDGDRRKLAYLLATAKHETAHTMQPIHERGRVAYFDKYEPGTKIGKNLGNTLKGDGYKFRGRGFVQLTGRTNYAKAGKKIGVDLLANPDAALVPEHAARILIAGCMEGWFTGRKLGDYINSAATFVAARRVVNGLDKADTIALMAANFLEAIEDEPAQPPAPPMAPFPPTPFDRPEDAAPPYSPPKRKTLADLLMGWLVKRTVQSVLQPPKGKTMTNTNPWTWSLRRVLELGGMALVMFGISKESDVATASTAIETITGAGSVLIGLAWNAWTSFKSKFGS